MPPVMGAAAFVMASFIGVTYFEVVKHAFLPAIISYIALFYISHLEALKLNLKGMDADEVPNLKKTFLSGLHFLIPIFVLVYLLVFMRFTASYSIFYATLSLILVNLLNKIIKESNFKDAIKATNEDKNPFIIGGGQIYNIAMKYTDTIELTRVHKEFEADTFFPKISEDEWQLINEEKHEMDERHKYSFTYKTYLKIK